MKLIHEYAHALLPLDVDTEPMQAKRGVEALGVADVVGQSSSWIRVVLRYQLLVLRFLYSVWNAQRVRSECNYGHQPE